MTDKDPAVLKMEANIVEKTGRPFAAWVDLIRKSGLQKHGEIVKLLKTDLGISLKGKPPAGRLEASASFNAMVSHRVRLESAKDVDAEVIAWLKEAFNAAG
jgi:hypothetical protein